MTKDSAYILGACSLLILQYSWACLEVMDSGPNGRSDLGFSSLLPLYSGMKQLGLTLWITYEPYDPYLHSIMAYRPIQKITHYFENTTMPLELESFFTHCCNCTKWCNTADGNFSIRMDAARSLIPLLSAFKLSHIELESSGFMPDISRCLFIWPLLTPIGFKQLVGKNDEASMVIVLYYYAAVLGVASWEFWWMRERSAHMSRSILIRLGDKCKECIGWAREICDVKYS